MEGLGGRERGREVRRRKSVRYLELLASGLLKDGLRCLAGASWKKDGRIERKAEGRRRGKAIRVIGRKEARRKEAWSKEGGRRKRRR